MAKENVYGKDIVMEIKEFNDLLPEKVWVNLLLTEFKVHKQAHVNDIEGRGYYGVKDSKKLVKAFNRLGEYFGGENWETVDAKDII